MSELVRGQSTDERHTRVCVAVVESMPALRGEGQPEARLAHASHRHVDSQRALRQQHHGQHRTGVQASVREDLQRLARANRQHARKCHAHTQGQGSFLVFISNSNSGYLYIE